MFKISKEQQGDTTVLHIVGTVDETTELEKHLSTPPPALLVNCKKIDRINSAGVRNWIRFFRGLASRGTKLKFQECSPAVVEQFNLIHNFLCGGEIESLFLPYACTHCRTQFFQLISVAKLKQIVAALPSPNCPKCGQATIFDEIEDEYFQFLKAA